MIRAMIFVQISSIAILVFIASISAQTSNENMCRVALFCDDDSPNIRSRKIRMNTVKGDIGPPGQTGQPGLRGPPGTSEEDQEMVVLDEIRQLKETFNQKFEAFAQQMADVEEIAARSESLVETYLGTMWGEGGFTASNGYRYKITPTESEDFWEAKRVCHSMAGRLAYEGVRNETVYREIIAWLNPIRWNNLCIDLTDLASEGNFVWGDGVPLSWSHWRQTEPNDNTGGQDCVSIQKRWSGPWVDIGCLLNCHSLCELPPA